MDGWRVTISGESIAVTAVFCVERQECTVRSFGGGGTGTIVVVVGVVVVVISCRRRHRGGGGGVVVVVVGAATATVGAAVLAFLGVVVEQLLF